MNHRLRETLSHHLGIAKQECDYKEGDARKACVKDARLARERAKAAGVAARTQAKEGTP